MKPEELIRQALMAREYSYSPYSHYQVGAALLCKDGSIYTGCNIENSAFGPTNCAERTAIFKAVSEGKQEFEAIAIVGGRQGEPIEAYAYPCGVCRQVMAEFGQEDFQIIVAKSEEEYESYPLHKILPFQFGLQK